MYNQCRQSHRHCRYILYTAILQCCVQSVQTSTTRRSVTQCSVLVTQAGCWPTVHEPVSHAIKPSGQLSHVLKLVYLLIYFALTDKSVTSS